MSSPTASVSAGPHHSKVPSFTSEISIVSAETDPTSVSEEDSIPVADSSEEFDIPTTRSRRPSALYPPLPSHLNLSETKENKEQSPPKTFSELRAHPYLADPDLFRHVVDYIKYLPQSKNPYIEEMKIQIKAAFRLSEGHSHSVSIERCIKQSVMQKIFGSFQDKPSSEIDLVTKAYRILLQFIPPCLFYHPWLLERGKIELLEENSEETPYKKYFTQILEVIDKEKISPLDAAKEVFTPEVLHALFGHSSHAKNGQDLKELIENLSEE